jgi:hypothetical protein
MASLKKDIKRSSAWLVKAFAALGKNLDYSVESIEHIEELLSKEFKDGQPIPNGLFEGGLGGKLFAVSAYIGEVVIKNTKATKWITDDNDPGGELNITLLSANGTSMFPAHRVMNRVRNGEEDNVYHYVVIAVKEHMKFDDEIPSDFFQEEESEPWWKFW